jgi:hypothetical protein
MLKGAPQRGVIIAVILILTLLSTYCPRFSGWYLFLSSGWDLADSLIMKNIYLYGRAFSALNPHFFVIEISRMRPAHHFSFFQNGVISAWM